MRPHTDKPIDESSTSQRFTVPEAAEVLGLTVEAIRGRIKRNTINYERTPEGVFVLLNRAPSSATEQSPTTDQPVSDKSSDKSELVEALRDQIAYLRNQLDREREARTEERRRYDTIVLQLSQRIPAIEAPPDTARQSPQEPRGSSVSNEEGPPYGTTPQDAEESLHHMPYGEAPRGDTEPSRAPWWRRLFGG
jgi:hypothetical protein